MDDISNFIIKLEKIFSVNVDFKINYLSSREEMNKVAGRETEDWVVGFAGKNEIFIFQKKLFPKISSQHSEEDFDKVLKHEIAHLFIHKSFGKGPAWFDEGLACILAGQQKNISNEKVNPLFLIKREDFRKQKNPYGKSVKLVYQLIESIKNEKDKI